MWRDLIALITQVIQHVIGSVGATTIVAILWFLGPSQAAVVLDDFTDGPPPSSQFIEVPNPGAYQRNAATGASIIGGARHTVLSISDKPNDTAIGLHQTIGGGNYTLRTDPGLVLATPISHYSGDVTDPFAKTLNFDAYDLLPGADSFALEVI